MTILDPWNQGSVDPEHMWSRLCQYVMAQRGVGRDPWIMSITTGRSLVPSSGPPKRVSKRGSKSGHFGWSLVEIVGSLVEIVGISGRDRREISSRIGTTLDPWNQGSWQHQDP